MVFRSNPLSDAIARPWDGYTAEDRERIRSEAARELLQYELDGDRTDPTWLRYCDRHGLDPAEGGR